MVGVRDRFDGGGGIALQPFAQGAEVAFRLDLLVFGAVEGEDRAGDVGELRAHVHRDETFQVGGIELVHDAVVGLHQHFGQLPALRRGEFLAGAERVVGFAEEGVVFLDVFLCDAGGGQRLVGLPDEGLFAGDDHAGQADDEVGLLLGGEHQGDGAAFAVADDADFVEAFAEELDAGQGVFLEVVRVGEAAVAGGGAEAAVVEAERGDAGAGEGVRDDGEGSMLEDLFVAVLQAAAGHRHEGGRLARNAFRQGQRAAQDDVAVAEGHFFLGIRERPLRGLRPVELLHARREGKGEGSTHLGESARDFPVLELPLEGGVEGGDVDGEFAGVVRFEVYRKPQGSLVGNIQRGVLRFEMEDDGERHSLDLKVAGPGAGLGGSIGQDAQQRDGCKN